MPSSKGGHLLGDRVIGMQDRPDRHVDRIVRTGVDGEFHLRVAHSVGDCEPDERVVLALDTNGESVRDVRVDDRRNSSFELGALLPRGEQVDVLGGAA
jgi:hypothetical protein